MRVAPVEGWEAKDYINSLKRIFSASSTYADKVSSLRRLALQRKAWRHSLVCAVASSMTQRSKFGQILRAQIMAENSDLRRGYVRMLVGTVSVNDNEIVIAGSRRRSKLRFHPVKPAPP